MRILVLFFLVLVRGGVEDTRLEVKAKAKDTKKIRGQGQAPRTQTQVFSEKKNVFKNFFSAISKKNGLEKHFLADLQNFNHLKNNAVLEPRTGQFSRT